MAHQGRRRGVVLTTLLVPPGVALVPTVLIMVVLAIQNLPQPVLAVLSVTLTGEREPLMISSASVFAECLPLDLRVPAA